MAGYGSGRSLQVETKAYKVLVQRLLAVEGTEDLASLTLDGRGDAIDAKVIEPRRGGVIQIMSNNNN